VRVALDEAPCAVEISIEDDGPGVANPTNLFCRSSPPSRGLRHGSCSAGRSRKITRLARAG